MRQFSLQANLSYPKPPSDHITNMILRQKKKISIRETLIKLENRINAEKIYKGEISNICMSHT